MPVEMTTEKLINNLSKDCGRYVREGKYDQYHNWNPGRWYIYEDGTKLGVDEPVIYFPSKDDATRYQERRLFFEMQLIRRQGDYENRKREMMARVDSIRQHGQTFHFDEKGELFQLKLLKAKYKAAQQEFDDYTKAERERAELKRQADEEALMYQQTLRQQNMSKADTLLKEMEKI